jgi:hypothetical protein
VAGQAGGVELTWKRRKKGKRSMTQPQASDTGLIPDPTLDSKAFKKVLMDRLRARGGTESVDTNNCFRAW